MEVDNDMRAQISRLGFGVTCNMNWHMRACVVQGRHVDRGQSTAPYNCCTLTLVAWSASAVFGTEYEAVLRGMHAVLVTGYARLVPTYT